MIQNITVTLSLTKDRKKYHGIICGTTKEDKSVIKQFKTDSPRWIQFHLPDPNGLFSAMMTHLEYIKKKENKPNFTCKKPKDILPYLITSCEKITSKPLINKKEDIVPFKDQFNTIIDKFN